MVLKGSRGRTVTPVSMSQTIDAAAAAAAAEAAAPAGGSIHPTLQKSKSEEDLVYILEHSPLLTAIRKSGAVGGARRSLSERHREHRSLSVDHVTMGDAEHMAELDHDLDLASAGAWSSTSPGFNLYVTACSGL